MGLDKIILGTVQMGLPYGVQKGGDLNYFECEAILKKAHRAGVRLLDAAEIYGKAHAVIGQFHRYNPHLRFDVMTKIPKNMDEGVEKKIAEYISELGVNQLEAVMFHAFETLKKNPEISEKLIFLKEQKALKMIGVSIYTNEELQEAITYNNIDLIQVPFNLFDNYSIRGRLLRSAKEKGKIIHTRSAFLQGLFFMDPGSDHPVVRNLRPQLLKIREITEKEKIDLTSLALNYCLQQDFIDKIVIGVDSLKQLKKNFSIIGEPVTPEVIKSINDIKVQNEDFLNPSLWN